MFMQSALDMKAKVASDAMVPIADVFMLDINGQLDHATMTKVLCLICERRGFWFGDRIAKTDKMYH